MGRWREPSRRWADGVTPALHGASFRTNASGVATSVHYTRPIHLQPAMAAAGGKPGDLPVSERLSREVLQVPLYPELPLETIERVAGEIKAFCTRREGS